MIAGPRHWPALWLCVVGAMSGPAAAAELEHVVRPGESASAVAQTYYGGFELTDLLLRFNGKTGPVIVPGETLRVPYCEVHAVKAGDTWSGIAQHYLGRAAGYEAIAELNGLDPSAPLRLGERIVVPVLLSHTLARGETLGRVAEDFYGDAGRADLLRSFNGIDDPRRLSVGVEIRVPVVSPRLAETSAPRSEPQQNPAESAPAVSTASGEGPRAVPSEAPAEDRDAERFAREVRAARRAFRKGEFERALDALESLETAVERTADPAARTEFWTLMAYVQVAFDHYAEACRAYRTATGATEPAALDRDLVSPKIRTALSRCDETEPGGTGE